MGYQFQGIVDALEKLRALPGWVLIVLALTWTAAVVLLGYVIERLHDRRHREDLPRYLRRKY